jgi:hypothetical protein
MADEVPDFDVGLPDLAVCNVPGVIPERVNDWRGSYVFNAHITEEQHAKAANVLFIVLELRVDGLTRAKTRDGVKCKHVMAINIVNGGWISPGGNHRALIPRHLTNRKKNKIVAHEDFSDHPEIDQLFKDNKYPGTDRDNWVEVLCSNLNKTKWGPCKFIIPFVAPNLTSCVHTTLGLLQMCIV